MIENTDRLVELVRERHPDWASFQDSGFVKDEIEYKKRSIAKAKEKLSEKAIRTSIDSGQFDAVIAALEEIGKDNNLLWKSVPTAGDLGVLYQPSLHKEGFCKAVLDLLHGRGPVEERLDRYLSHIDGQGLPNKWTFPTYFLFLLHPESEFFVKPATIGRFLRVIDEPELPSTPSGTEYARVKSVMARLKQLLEPYGPKDMVDVQSFVWVAVHSEQEHVVSRERVSEFQALFREFAAEYLPSGEAKSNAELRVQGRREAKSNWMTVLQAHDKGKDITDLVLLKLLPYVDSESNRKQGAWVHVAPSITGDLRRWYESAGWVSAKDWPKVATTIFDFVRRCVDAPEELEEACEALEASAVSKGFQQGMLSPILNALAPDRYMLVNNKSRRMMNYLTDAKFGQGIGEYPAANAHLKRTVADLEEHMTAPSGAEASIEDVFDTFCHWMVSVKKHPLRQTRYWKVAPGEDAWNWQACLGGGYIAVGWDELGDLSQMDRKAFVEKAEELIRSHPDWTKVGVEQVWKFSRIKEGDVIIANQGTSQILGIGIVNGQYYFVEGERHGHRLPVIWEDTSTRTVNEGGWRRTLVELDRAKFEELVGAPPTAPASASFNRVAFDLLTQLHQTPTRAFYDLHKTEFKQYVEEPVRALLLQAVDQLPESMRVVLETKTGLFSRIPKNDFGHGGAWSHYWGALYPKGGKRIEAAQLYVSIQPSAFRYGFSLGEYAGIYRERFLSNWRKHAAALKSILPERLADERIIFGTQEERGHPKRVELGAWMNDPEAAGLNAAVLLAPDEACAIGLADLAADVARVFQMLFPLFLLAVSDDPLPEIQEYLEPEEEAEAVANPVYSIAQMAGDTFVTEDQLVRWVTSVERKKHAVFYGPPGTGKTFVARKLATHLIGGGDGFMELVQFHPSYAYEDFLQGIRPRASVDGALSYTLQDGVFKRFCSRAQAKSGKCVLIIDEINRANLSRVFGELMFLLEYRENQIPLAYGGTFQIPDNVYILGTMNTADRSIALVDHALRRRFAFIRLSPNYDILRSYHREMNTGYDVEELIAVLTEVNRDIGEDDYHVGISYFLTPELGDHIQDIWRMEIEPYLEEYFFDHRDKAQRYRWEKIGSRVSV
ncbi:MAG: DUF2461 family protein [Armatimonadetes bacterium]|nr:DUF2461 family protein [Armatimonadota bacterium]